MLRAAANAPLQGSASDIMKLAMLAVHRQLKAGGFASRILLQASWLLTVIPAPTDERGPWLACKQCFLLALLLSARLG